MTYAELEDAELITYRWEYYLPLLVCEVSREAVRVRERGSDRVLALPTTYVLDAYVVVELESFL